MIDFLIGIDTWLLLFINRTLANPVGDILWPLITDYDKLLVVRVVLACVIVALVWKGGRRGRTVVLLLIPILFVGDKLNSEILKEIIDRARPCHEVDGSPIVPGLHLLVHCGPGRSLPSSHAVNNFAVAFLFARFYPQYRWAFFAWAGLVALSRPAVGVHYPSDIMVGAVVGIGVSAIVIFVFRKMEPVVLEWLKKRKGTKQMNEVGEG
ncbi:MAG: phosphatase PAP2 family protein [Ignavibacteria bacterium]|nr:phosphatase PAP2 family protein [Ignavibacteria bacterium]